MFRLGCGLSVLFGGLLNANNLTGSFFLVERYTLQFFAFLLIFTGLSSCLFAH